MNPKQQLVFSLFSCPLMFFIALNRFATEHYFWGAMWFVLTIWHGWLLVTSWRGLAAQGSKP